jgi:hypothetical protein
VRSRHAAASALHTLGLRANATRGRAPGQEAERGSAIIEFSFLAVLLLVPLTYVILTVFQLQGGAYAVSSAAREAGRIYVTSDAGVARERAVAAARVAMRDHGFTLAARNVDIRCSDPDACHAPRGTVHVTVEHRVSLPLIPEFFDGVVPTSVRVSADHVEYVDRFTARS